MSEAARVVARRVDTFVTNWWFGHVLLLGLCGGILLLALVITPSTEMLDLFGQEIPVLCGFRKMFGIPCPGCGMTRSFVFLAHGDLVSGFRMNLLGPPLFAFVFAQVPFQVYKLVQGYRARIRSRGPRGG